jgi:lamin tail-like protein
VGIRLNLWTLIGLALAAAFSACESPTAVVVPGPIGQGSEPRSVVAINEISVNAPAEPDWLEIVNRSDETVDLSGYFVTDALDRLDHYFALPAGTRLEATRHLVVQCGGASAVNPLSALRTNFKLGRADAAWLVAPDGIPVDGTNFLASDDGSVLARIPDGEGMFFAAEPTPGMSNGASR